jgi:hypothetical protein
MIEKLLRKQAAESKLRLIELQEQQDSLTSLMNIEIAMLKDVYTELQKFCSHTNHKTTSKYSSGGYDHKSYTLYTVECLDCGKELNTRTEMGGFQ